MYDIEFEYNRLRSITEDAIYEIVVEKNDGKITFTEDSAPFLGNDMNYSVMVTSVYRENDSVNIFVNTENYGCVNILDLSMEELIRIYLAIK